MDRLVRETRRFERRDPIDGLHLLSPTVYLLTSIALHGLYTKFEKSKTKNTDPLIFFSSEFWDITPRNCWKEYISVYSPSLSLAYISMAFI